MDSPMSTTDDHADGIPVGGSAPAASGSSFAQSITSGFNSALAQLNPIAQKASNSFFRAKQIAEETIGTAEKTEMSEYYKSLEARVDKIKLVHENLIKVATHFVSPSPATGVKLEVANVVTNVADAVSLPSESSLVNKLKSVNLDTQSAGQVLGQQFTKNGQLVGTDTALGTALLKCGEVHENLGRARLQLNLEIYEKFVKTFDRTLESHIKHAMACRKAVYNARIELDACRTRARAAKGEKAVKLNDELEAANQNFENAVNAAIAGMKTVIASTEPLANLADFMAAMLAYYQRGFELLSELAPEIDAMKVAQEALSPEERINIKTE